MKFAEAIKNRKYIVTGWRYASGEALFRAFDAAFNLPPITEFAYLLRYV